MLRPTLPDFGAGCGSSGAVMAWTCFDAGRPVPSPSWLAGVASLGAMLRYAAHTDGTPRVAWRLLARPEHWPDWSPHLRGAWGLTDDDGWVRPGARGAARLLAVLPVPAKILAVEHGRSWTWRIGPVDMEHRVEPDSDGEGCTVEMTITAPPPVEAALRVSYGPALGLLVRHLARVAQRV